MIAVLRDLDYFLNASKVNAGLQLTFSPDMKLYGKNPRIGKSGEWQCVLTLLRLAVKKLLS